MDDRMIRRIMMGVGASNVFEMLYTPASTTANIQIDIPHNLGKMPKMLIGIPEGDVSGRTNVLCGALVLFNVVTDIQGVVSGLEKYGCQFLVNNGVIGNTAMAPITVSSSSISMKSNIYVHPNVKIRFYVFA